MTTNTKTPAMLLQEYTVRKKVGPPEYDLVFSNTGTHENEFHFKVTVGGVQAIGIGRSKQVAKHAAAFKAIQLLTEMGYYDEETPSKDFQAQMHRNEPENYGQGAVNNIGQLNDICCENKLPYPRFNEISDVGPPHCRQFTWECELSSIKTQATANTKKQAKQIAAKLMLDRVKDILPDLIATSEDARNAITNSDDETRDRYVELSIFNVIPSKSSKIDEFPSCFSKLMSERKISFDDLTEFLIEKDEENLNKIFSKLDLKFQFVTIQEKPAIVALHVSTDTPFDVLGMGDSVDIAKTKALFETFEYLEVYLKNDDFK